MHLYPYTPLYGPPYAPRGVVGASTKKKKSYNKSLNVEKVGGARGSANAEISRTLEGEGLF